LFYGTTIFQLDRLNPINKRHSPAANYNPRFYNKKNKFRFLIWSFFFSAATCGLIGNFVPPWLFGLETKPNVMRIIFRKPSSFFSIKEKVPRHCYTHRWTSNVKPEEKDQQNLADEWWKRSPIFIVFKDNFFFLVSFLPPWVLGE
jgi:hypothetical protein